MFKFNQKSKKFMSFVLAWTMIISFFAPVLVKAETNPNSQATTKDKTINVISFNDFHGNVDEDTRTKGKNVGMAKLVGAIKEYKNANPNTLVVSAGDNYQGSAMSNLTHGEPVSAMMKELGVVASSVGNHEFDWGIKYIEQWAKEGNFDYLASNIYDKKTGKPVEWAKPYKIVTIDGVKIGFVGLTTPESEYKTKPENVANLEFKSPKEAAKIWADKLKSGTLKEGKADVVIALTHMGSMQDASGKITGEIVDSGLCDVVNVDAIISSHTHMRVSGTVNNKPVVQGMYAGRALGNLSIVVDSKTGKVKSITPNVDDIYKRKNQLVADKATEAIYNKYNAKVKPLLDKVVGATDRDLIHDRFDEGTSLLGQWATDVMRKAVEVQIGITNGGGLRCPILKGDITMGKLYEVMPFDNTLVKMELKGSDLKRVIENGIANTEIGWAQVSGVKVYYDKNLPKGNRITDMVMPDGTDVDLDKYYTVVTNDFMYSGGDQYDFAGAKNIVDTGKPIREALAEALEAMNGKVLSITDVKPLVNGSKPEVTPSKPEEKTEDQAMIPLVPATTITTGTKDEKAVISKETSTPKEVAIAKLPKTGATVDMDVIAGLGTASMTIAVGLFFVGKKKEEKKVA